MPYLRSYVILLRVAALAFESSRNALAVSAIRLAGTGRCHLACNRLFVPDGTRLRLL